MPLLLPQDLPASQVLQDENIFIMPHNRASTQDIRPLEILIVNLMPDKISTEKPAGAHAGQLPFAGAANLAAHHQPPKHPYAFLPPLGVLQDAGRGAPKPF